MQDESRARGRYFLRDSVRLATDFSRTDQSLGLPAPPLEKPCPPGATRLALPTSQEWQGIRDVDITAAIAERQSHRRYLPEPLTLDDLSYLLWATQGVRERPNAGSALRTVPSAGCRHAFETYICALNVLGLTPAIYRYLPLEHELVLEREVEGLAHRLISAALRQSFVGRAAATFIWSCLPYRMEWRYGGAAHKVIAIDAGHVCQNLYLACAAVGAGTCAIAAYHQQQMDELLDLDGEDEFVIYLAPVGKV
jgi:SagB-type dehydrogenase family enzyme